MFEMIPCVDIQGGRAVRLFEGNPDKETVYFEKPLDAAKHWVSLGATWLHLVDLDAALSKGNNNLAIGEITAELDVNIEVGGGIRSLEAARKWLEIIDRVVLGTVAIHQPEIVDALVADYGADRVVVSIDAKDGLVAVKGWAELSNVQATDLAQRVIGQGVTHVIYTDITRDGTLKGVNPEPVKAMREVFPHVLIAGGGVARDSDIDLYESLGLEGAIVGRALYEGTITYPRRKEKGEGRK
ncbi:MAG: 1-(5-phosphoribosyl)-5-[(5-phosphoribosylamino)methylideneamino]imidazole-4-carboxamide isomerase [Trueperaceae bacterium]